MTVALIRPPSIHSNDAFSAGTVIPPIGLALISAYLIKNQIETRVIDCVGEGISQFHKIEEKNCIVYGLSLDEILNSIPHDADVIGVSCMFSSEWFYHDFLITQIRQKFPNKKIVVGGEHSTADWKNILNLCPAVDFCVLGEGEETFLELIQAIRGKKSFEDIQGIAYREAQIPKKNGPRKRVKKLDEIPWPDWKQFPIQNYLNAGHSQASINRRAMPILASRGCPFSCTFCTSPQMWSNELYLRDPKDVIQEIKYLYETYRVEHIDFIDIVGVLNPKWTKELLTLLTAENLPVTWLHGAGTRSEILTEEIIDLFKKSKALRIFYAPESGSKKTIKNIRKRVDLDKMTKSMKYTNQLGISMRAPLIIGFPGQTLFEVFESFVFGLKMVIYGVDDIVVHTFSAHPGSEIYNNLVAKKIIDIDQLIKDNKYYDFLRGEIHSKIFKQNSWSENIPERLMPFIQLGSMFIFYILQFLLRPVRILRILKRVIIHKKPLTLFDHTLYHLLYGSKFKIKFENMAETKYIEKVAAAGKV